MQHQKSTMPPDLKKWAEAKKKHRLSQMHVCMAMELGLNPRKMSRYAPNPHEQWKAPLPDFIERIYEKRFGTSHKPIVRSFVQIAESRQKKKAPKQQARAAQGVAAITEPNVAESQPTVHINCKSMADTAQGKLDLSVDELPDV